MHLSRRWLFFVFCLPLAAQQEELNSAYAALGQKDYDTAIASFQLALAKQPNAANVHKDLAYTYLKAGESAAARDEFAAAQKLNPQDEDAMLEFAFLAFETGKPIEARRTFDKLRKTAATAQHRQTAEQAFQNVDGPLASGIARWQQAIRQAPKPNDLSMFSAHWELGQLAELRDDPALAAHEYEICRALKPQLSEVLLILARLWQQTKRGEEAQAALLAASRSTSSRTAEQALELYGNRYPYPYEFVKAIQLDPLNFPLRRELGYLYLAMNDKEKAIEQFEGILSLNPRDETAREQLNALRGFKTRAAQVPQVAAPAAAATSAVSPKEMGLKSLAAGYSNDAVKYLRQAHEIDPNDDEVKLKLGWAYNLAKDDNEAKRWFAYARASNDNRISAEASKAYHNLNGDVPAQTTAWMLPMYSTRWNDLFAYGQIKRSVPLPMLDAVNRWVAFYVSTRFIGDVHSSFVSNTVLFPQYLSESSFIFGVGASSRTWHRLTGWVEAGESVKYLNRKDVGMMVPDYRGGVNFAKGFGSLLSSAKGGFYYETTGDAIYVSRFGKDWLFYSQNRAGRTIPLGEKNSLQLLWNTNVVMDAQRQYWANTVEMGPGIKFRPAWLPKNVYFSADYMHGFYLMESPRPDYNDLRIGLWYAATR